MSLMIFVTRLVISAYSWHFIDIYLKYKFYVSTLARWPVLSSWHSKYFFLNACKCFYYFNKNRFIGRNVFCNFWLLVSFEHTLCSLYRIVQDKSFLRKVKGFPEFSTMETYLLLLIFSTITTTLVNKYEHIDNKYFFRPTLANKCMHIRIFLGDMEGRALSLRHLNLFSDKCMNDVSFNHLCL